jgi:hypothetical protein
METYLNASLVIPYNHGEMAMGCPMLFDSHSANISTFLSTRSANLSITRLRCVAVHVLHSPWKAERAAATAVSTSATDATWMPSATREASWGL